MFNIVHFLLNFMVSPFSLSTVLSVVTGYLHFMNKVYTYILTHLNTVMLNLYT